MEKLSLNKNPIIFLMQYTSCIVPFKLMPSQSNTKRIARNTLMLYFRQILIMAVSLYTVRVVLDVLGAEDFGIYGVVGGVVTFFSFLSGTMASATQRFFSFALGKNDEERLKQSFCVNLVIYVLIALVALLLLETIGLWFVHNRLSVPAERFSAACSLFQFTVLSFLASIITSPFLAIVIAHEDMHIYASISIVEVFLKLVIVFLLKIIAFDKLVLYGLLMFVIQLCIAFVYLFVCEKKYSECQFRKLHWNGTLFKETIDFTGWSLFGAFTSVGRNQAVTILLNQFFTPVVIAARTIAVTVSGRINTFSANFNTSLYPPIIKEYAANNKEGMFRLIFNGSKMTFFLMWVFALPLFLHMDYVLSLWLKNPPENAVLFTRLALLESVINASALPLMTAARAQGKMKWYELPLGSVQLLIFIADWIFLHYGFGAWIVFIVAAAGNIVMYVMRLVFVKILVGLPARKFIKNVLFPIFVIAITSVVPSYFVARAFSAGFLFVAFSVLFSVVVTSAFMYAFGMDKTSRKKVYTVVKNKIGFIRLPKRENV